MSAHDLAGICNHSEPEYFHFSGLRIYCYLAHRDIHGIQLFAPLVPEGITGGLPEYVANR